MHITVHGLEEAKAKLGKMGYVVDQAVDNAIREAAEPMKAEAVNRAPRRTGRLAESIELTKIGKHEWQIGTPPRSKVFWDLFQEIGVVHHRAQPYLRPAFEAERAGTIERFGRYIRGVVEGVRR